MTRCTCVPGTVALCPRCVWLLSHAVQTDRRAPPLEPPRKPQGASAPPGRAARAGQAETRAWTRQEAPAAPLDCYRSETERRYAAYLDSEVNAGMVAAWWYEPMKGLYLAPKTSYTPDFLVQYCDGERGLECHEVKGAKIWEKDRIKAKLAARLYPCFRFLLAQWKESRWTWTHIPAQ